MGRLFESIVRRKKEENSYASSSRLTNAPIGTRDENTFNRHSFDSSCVEIEVKQSRVIVLRTHARVVHKVN